MSYYDDYVADGLCCQSCGALLDMDEPGFARFCAGCDPDRQPRPKPKHNKRRRKGK